MLYLQFVTLPAVCETVEETCQIVLDEFHMSIGQKRIDSNCLYCKFLYL